MQVWPERVYLQSSSEVCKQNLNLISSPVCLVFGMYTGRQANISFLVSRSLSSLCHPTQEYCTCCLTLVVGCIINTCGKCCFSLVILKKHVSRNCMWLKMYAANLSPPTPTPPKPHTCMHNVYKCMFRWRKPIGTQVKCSRNKLLSH